MMTIGVAAATGTVIVASSSIAMAITTAAMRAVTVLVMCAVAAVLFMRTVAPLLIPARWVITRRLPLRSARRLLEIVPSLVVRVVLRDPARGNARFVRRRGINGARGWRGRAAVAGSRGVLLLGWRGLVASAAATSVLLSRIITAPYI